MRVTLRGSKPDTEHLASQHILALYTMFCFLQIALSNSWLNIIMMIPPHCNHEWKQ